MKRPEPVGVVPQVGVADRELDEVQPRCELDEFHLATVTSGRAGMLECLLSADRPGHRRERGNPT